MKCTQRYSRYALDPVFDTVILPMLSFCVRAPHPPTLWSCAPVANLQIVDRECCHDGDTGQVGGYLEVYDGITFSTVRNAGHMVPYTQAERAHYLFSHWIHDKVL